jgi:hypothetical protein
MSTTRSIGREIGTALAVLAIYLLTVLAPLHQARASQLAFEELGYTTVETSWVLCTPAGVDGEDRDTSPNVRRPLSATPKWCCRYSMRWRFAMMSPWPHHACRPPLLQCHGPSRRLLVPAPLRFRSEPPGLRAIQTIIKTGISS